MLYLSFESLPPIEPVELTLQMSNHHSVFSRRGNEEKKEFKVPGAQGEVPEAKEGPSRRSVRESPSSNLRSWM